MTYLQSEATLSYKKAVLATESIESPALGFIRPADYKGANTGQAALIKQNNTLIQLVVDLSEKVTSLSDNIKTLRDEVRQLQKGKEVVDITDDLISKLERLTLGQPEPKPKEKKGTLRVFKDPFKILDEENAKLGLKKQVKPSVST